MVAADRDFFPRARRLCSKAMAVECFVALSRCCENAVERDGVAVQPVTALRLAKWYDVCRREGRNHRTIWRLFRLRTDSMGPHAG